MREGDFDQSAEHGLVARPVGPTQEVIRVDKVRNLQGERGLHVQKKDLDRVIQHTALTLTFSLRKVSALCCISKRFEKNIVSQQLANTVTSPCVSPMMRPRCSTRRSTSLHMPLSSLTSLANSVSSKYNLCARCPYQTFHLYRRSRQSQVNRLFKVRDQTSLLKSDTETHPR